MTNRLLTLRDRLELVEARIDAARRKCTTGYGCGSTCINVKKECRSEGGAAISKERIERLEQLARGEIKPRGLGTPKPAEAAAMAEGLRSARGSKAQELLGQRKATREAKAAEEAAKAAEAAAKAKAREAAKAKEAPAGTPRGEADRAAKAADPDYEFARPSTVGNVGEDLKGSARHKANQWRSLSEAEANGTAGKGPGGGEKCGGGWIDPNKTCRKGEGGAAVDRPYEAKRSKPKETIVFPEPIVGPTGAKLTAYTWQWTLTEDVDHRGEPVEKRVSDWEKSIANVETGRNVVHQFQVEVGGETRTVSAESALKLMGFLSETDRKAFGSLKSSARTVARLRMAQQEVEQRAKRLEADWQEVSHLPKAEIKVGEWKPDPKDPAIQWRDWQMGEAREHEMQSVRRGRGSTDDEMRSMVRGAWLNGQMQARGWGEGKGWWRYGNERDSLNRQRDDLAKRLARAEAKLMAQTRSDATDRIDSLLTRLDALQRRCSTGYACGSACISLRKECRSQGGPGSRERIERLEQLARGEIKPRGLGVPKPADAKAMASKLRAELNEQQALLKAERKRQQAAAEAAGVKKPKVIVLLRRAKPGGEHGPDGHWYPGGAWMSEGRYVGAKPVGGQGQGDARDQKEKPKDGREQRVVRPKRPSFPERPLKPKGEGLPQPTGLKKMAAKNDELFFGSDGYILYPQPKGAPGLQGSLFEAAVIQRMTTDELKWATEQIRQKVYASKDQRQRDWFDDVQANIDDDIARYGGPQQFSKDHRWTARTQLTGVDADHYIAGVRFMAASHALGGTSEASQRRQERYRDPRFEDWNVPKRGPHDEWVWALNNVFRAVRIRRGRA